MIEHQTNLKWVAKSLRRGEVMVEVTLVNELEVNNLDIEEEKGS